VVTRRPRGTGSLRQIAGGRWRLRVSIGVDPVTRRPRQVERVIKASTQRAAQRELDRLREEVRASPPATRDNRTVRSLLEHYLAHLEARGRSPRTIHAARLSAERVIGPELGRVRLAELDTFRIDELYRKLATGEGRRRPVRPATVLRHHSVLSAALNQAVRWGWIADNPAKAATLPTLERRSPRVPSAEDVAELIRRVDEAGPVWGLLVRLAVVTGARRGELCALRWSDVEEGRLWIRRVSMAIRISPPLAR